MSARDTSGLDWVDLTEGEKEERRREVITLDWLVTNGQENSSPAAALKQRIPRSNWPESVTYATQIRQLREAGITALTSDRGGHTIGLGVYLGEEGEADDIVYLVNSEDSLSEGITSKEGWTVTWCRGEDGMTFEMAERLTSTAALYVTIAWVGEARRMGRESRPHPAF